MQRKDILAWAAVILGCAGTASVLFFYFHATTGQWVPSVLPQVEEDSLYYLAQAKEVMDGHPSLGNPYIREYADVRFPGLLLPVWIAALPGLFGMEINSVFAFNALLYSVLTGAVLFALCLRGSGGKHIISVIAAVLGTASIHNLLIRPAIMQTVYPCFGIFLLALLAVLMHPHKRYVYILYGLTVALSFYMYPFLWMTTITATGLLMIRMLWQRDWKSLGYLLLTCTGIVLACIPQILTFISFFHDTAAAELSLRNGVIYSHRVLPLTITNLKYTILFVSTLIFLSYRRPLSAAETLLLIVGGSLPINALSNVVTGVNLNFETHFWLFELMLIPVVLATFIPKAYDTKASLEKTALGLCAAALLFTIVNRTFIRANSYRYLRTATASVSTYRSLQEYGRIFDFFNRAGIRDQVILSDENIGRYIPIYTKNYVFYYFRASLHIIPANELLTRFLTHYINRITPTFLAEETEGYSGSSQLYAAIYLNAYGGNVQPIDLIGGQAFIQRALQEHASIKLNYENILKEYSVAYVVTDRSASNNPRLPAAAKKIFDDERFTIYTIK